MPVGRGGYKTDHPAISLHSPLSFPLSPFWVVIKQMRFLYQPLTKNKYLYIPIMKAYLTILVCLLPFALRAQIITTIAGNGVAGDVGEGGAASSAEVFYPTWGIFDAHGNYYFSESAHNKVRKISADGIITTIAGNGIAGFSGDSALAIDAQLDFPEGVAIDTNENIYIPDLHNNRIRKIDAVTGIIITYAGNGTTGYSGDSSNATDAVINGPSSVACDHFGNLFISDHLNNRIRKVNSLGIITTYAGTGVAGFNGDNGLADTSELMLPLAVVCDLLGNLYITDGNARIRKVDINTKIITTIAGNGSTTFGGDGGPATNAGSRWGLITLDHLGNLYVSDESNHRVRKVDILGTINTVVGTGIAGYNGDGILASSAELNEPEGVATDSCGNLYIADFVNQRIRKVAFNPACWPESVETPTKPTSITLYPNPTYSTVTITTPKGINNITITNTLGQQVFNRTFTTTKAEIDISHFPQGMYIVRVNDVYVQKLVKE